MALIIGSANHWFVFNVIFKCNTVHLNVQFDSVTLCATFRIIVRAGDIDRESRDF